MQAGHPAYQIAEQPELAIACMNLELSVELRLNYLELAIELQTFVVVDESGKIRLRKIER